jgi:predicted neutral ceramidase superfamily lipid hydrolase
MKVKKDKKATIGYVQVVATNLRNEASNVARQVREKFDAIHTGINGLLSNQQLLKQFADQQSVINAEVVKRLKELSEVTDRLASAERGRQLEEKQAICPHETIQLRVNNDGRITECVCCPELSPVCVSCGKVFPAPKEISMGIKIWRRLTGE